MNNKQNKSNSRKSKKVSRSIKGNTGRADLKICETGLSTFSIITGTLINCLPIQVGTSYNERIANKINIIKSSFRAIIRCGGALVGNTQAVVRVMILRDKRQVDSTLPSSTDVLTLALPNAQLNYFNLGRFQILKDSKYTVDVYNPSVVISESVPVSGIAKYSSNALGSITMDGIYLLLLTDNTTNAPTLDYSLRVYFDDP